jgi:formylmethanofuran dehydrogenase subunit A
MPADLVVFDPDTVSGPADYNRLEDPRGIDYVLVNGRVVAKYGKVEATFPGKVIRKRNESPLKILEEPTAPVEKSNAKVDSPPAKNHDVVSEHNKKRMKEAPTTRKVGKRPRR